MHEGPNLKAPIREGQDRREKLPVHAGSGIDSVPYVLRVDGRVRRCLELTPTDLEHLPQRGLTEDFTCLEGWTVPAVKWSGVSLDAVLSLADPLPDAGYVQASAREFSLPLSRDEASRALLAIRLDGNALPIEHGGPVRLIVPGGQCFMQIKWLAHLELCKEPGANTAETTALNRLPSDLQR